MQDGLSAADRDIRDAGGVLLRRWHLARISALLLTWAAW